MNYRYSHLIGFLSVSGRGFNNPVDLVVGDEDTLYVLNRAGSDVAERMISKRISICTVQEEYYGEFAYGGTEQGQLMWPSAMAMGADGNLYVSDEALNRISIFETDGGFVGRWGKRGNLAGEFNRPSGIAFDDDGSLLVADGMNHRIQRYTADGQYLGGWGSEGTADGEFSFPWGLSVDALGNVFVADWRNDRVQKFDADGKHLVTYGAQGIGKVALNRPSGVTLDVASNIYIADWGSHRVRIIDPDGNPLADFRGNAGLSKWSEDYFRANPDELEERRRADLAPTLDPLTTYDTRDESASIEKYFWSPTSVKLDDKGRMFVVDSCRHRIQIYQASERKGKANA
ncbi:MAG: NHL repeat-containing protein [Chloroflexota bacterium]|nr:NHL repeat-containing protein [Chloroflexota bacterium]